MHAIAYQDDIDAFQIVVTTLIVLISVTVNFMSLNREAKLKFDAVNLTNERDSLIRGLPSHTQVLILSASSK